MTLRFTPKHSKESGVLPPQGTRCAMDKPSSLFTLQGLAGGWGEGAAVIIPFIFIYAAARHSRVTQTSHDHNDHKHRQVPTTYSNSLNTCCTKLAVHHHSRGQRRRHTS